MKSKSAQKVSRSSPARRGRPPAPPERARPHRVVTFVTHAEMAKLEQMSEDAEKSLSAVAHEILSRSLRHRNRRRIVKRKSEQN